MAIAKTLETYLKAQGAKYHLKAHSYSEGSYNTARAAAIEEGSLAKGVLLRDEDLSYRLCVLPANHKILRHTLNQIFDRHLELVAEEELADIFTDCAPGAIPALGEAYGIPIIWDETLADQAQVYCEAGDHQHLICLGRDTFLRLMAQQMQDRFSSERRRYRFRKEHKRRTALELEELGRPGLGDY